jgi:hypothetical protein
MTLPLTTTALQFQSPDPVVKVKRDGTSFVFTRGLGAGWRAEYTLAFDPANEIRVLSGIVVTNGTTPTTLGSAISVYEYAINARLTADSNLSFSGNAHGRDFEDGLAVIVDGAVVSLDDAQEVEGREVLAVRSSTLRDGATDIGNAEVRYLVTQRGIDIDTRIDWLADLIAGTAYTAMLPLTTAVDRGKVEGSATADLTINDGRVAAQGEVRTAWCWQSAGNIGAGLLMRTLEGTREWTPSDGRGLWVQDRDDAVTNKIYSGYRPLTIGAGEVWRSSWRIMVEHFDGGAANVLA